jgi:hypothetical protein
MLVGDRPQAKPVGGDAATESCIVPENPCRPVIVIVEVPVTPARAETLVGLATRAKSCTEYETDKE